MSCVCNHVTSSSKIVVYGGAGGDGATRNEWQSRAWKSCRWMLDDRSEISCQRKYSARNLSAGTTSSESILSFIMMFHNSTIYSLHHILMCVSGRRSSSMLLRTFEKRSEKTFKSACLMRDLMNFFVESLTSQDDHTHAHTWQLNPVSHKNPEFIRSPTAVSQTKTSVKSFADMPSAECRHQSSDSLTLDRCKVCCLKPRGLWLSMNFTFLSFSISLPLPISQPTLRK